MNLKRIIYLTYSKFVKIKNKNWPEFRKNRIVNLETCNFFICGKRKRKKNTKYTKPKLKYIFNNICTSLKSKEIVEVNLVIHATQYQEVGCKMKWYKPRIQNNRFPNYQIPNYEMIKSSNSFNNYPLHSKNLKLQNKPTQPPFYFTLGKILLPVIVAIFLVYFTH